MEGGRATDKLRYVIGNWNELGTTDEHLNRRETSTGMRVSVLDFGLEARIDPGRLQFLAAVPMRTLEVTW